MLFSEALAELEKGNYIVRDGWGPNDGYIVLMPRMAFIWRITTLPNPNAGTWMATVDELKATDWVLLKDVPAEVPLAVVADVEQPKVEEAPAPAAA